MATSSLSPYKLLVAACLARFCSSAAVAYPPYNALSHSGHGHNLSFDYVIVGSGPGGLVMANRLTEQANVSVAVIEAGSLPEDTTGNLTTVPGYNFVFDLISPAQAPSAIDWGFVTTPQPGLNDVLILDQLGGSSNLNAMAWAESSKGAFDRWADEIGDESFRFATVEKYYNKAITFTPPDQESRRANATPSYDPAPLGKTGPLAITYPAYAHSWSTWLLVALQAIGVRNTDTFLTGNLNGSAWQVNTINHTTGARASADRAYLRPYLQRPNLAVFNGTLAERIIFDGRKVAQGVQVTTGNSSYILRAKREVILSGGSFQSSQLLQVSGVGPAAVLQEHGIPVIADRPGVGLNMNDQLFFGIAHRVDLPTDSTLAANVALDVELFNTNATGRLTSPGGEISGFEKIPAELRANFSASTSEMPKLKRVFHLFAALASFPSDWPEMGYLTLPNFTGNGTAPSPNDGYNYASIFATLMAPTSIGNVSISSSRMSDPPVINPNWLTTQSDIEVSIAMFKRLRQAWAVPALRNGLNTPEEYYPGPSVQTDAQIEAFIRSNMVPLYHGSATNKMGKKGDELAVVDSHGRVFGVEHHMLAEKIADQVKNGQ
ncbi:MAG: hypothetical protein Q9228_002316 [Teloschistes exilis]